VFSLGFEKFTRPAIGLGILLILIKKKKKKKQINKKRKKKKTEQPALRNYSSTLIEKASPRRMNI
jgi:hypothetical protein